MPAPETAAFALLVVAFVSQSRRLQRLHLTAPIIFTALGGLLGVAANSHVNPSVVRGLAEATLALVLFHDAAQVQPRQLRADAGLCLRLLLVGLPLTVLLGFGTARLLAPDASVWLALLLAAALAPTDAGLGAATVLNPVVPVRVRRLLNVESGLNDGLATPIVLLAIATTGSAAAAAEGGVVVTALRELAVGVLVGVVLSAGCGRLLTWAVRRGWVDDGLSPVATLAVPLLTYYGSVALDGNGFIAAFVSGTAYAAALSRPNARPASSGRTAKEELRLAEWVSVVLGYAVWTLFGVMVIANLTRLFTWQGLVFAVLSLTVLRMLPVAVALLGTGIRPHTVGFIGWFGPRGLASVIFALIAAESLSPTPGLEPVLGAIAVTVLLSVVLHGITADAGARAYGAWASREQPTVELADTVEPVAGRGPR